MDSLSFRVKMVEKPHTVLVPDLLTFKLQQEVLKLNDIYVSCSSPKTDLVKKSLNQEN